LSWKAAGNEAPQGKQWLLCFLLSTGSAAFQIQIPAENRYKSKSMPPILLTYDGVEYGLGLRPDLSGSGLKESVTVILDGSDDASKCSI
jgi:hypothetical protein